MTCCDTPKKVRVRIIFVDDSIQEYLCNGYELLPGGAIWIGDRHTDEVLRIVPFHRIKEIASERVATTKVGDDL